jgi:hypothetical protein
LLSANRAPIAFYDGRLCISDGTSQRSSFSQRYLRGQVGHRRPSSSCPDWRQASRKVRVGENTYGIVGFGIPLVMPAPRLNSADQDESLRFPH